MLSNSLSRKLQSANKSSTMAEKNKPLFLVSFRDPKDGKIAAIKVREISDSTLGLSFVRLANFVFETQGVLIKPSEEQLMKRLEGVKSLHLSVYSIVSIEELSETKLKFDKDKSNLLVLPGQSGEAPSPQA